MNKLLRILRSPFAEQVEVEEEYARDTPQSEYKLGVYLNSCSS